jgi:hypothetical protein
MQVRIALPLLVASLAGGVGGAAQDDLKQLAEKQQESTRKLVDAWSYPRGKTDWWCGDNDMERVDGVLKLTRLGFTGGYSTSDPPSRVWEHYLKQIRHPRPDAVPWGAGKISSHNDHQAILIPRPGFALAQLFYTGKDRYHSVTISRGDQEDTTRIVVVVRQPAEEKLLLRRDAAPPGPVAGEE